MTSQSKFEADRNRTKSQICHRFDSQDGNVITSYRILWRDHDISAFLWSLLFWTFLPESLLYMHETFTKEGKGDLSPIWTLFGALALFDHLLRRRFNKSLFTFGGQWWFTLMGTWRYPSGFQLFHFCSCIWPRTNAPDSIHSEPSHCELTTFCDPMLYSWRDHVISNGLLWRDIDCDVTLILRLTWSRPNKVQSKSRKRG